MGAVRAYFLELHSFLFTSDNPTAASATTVALETSSRCIRLDGNDAKEGQDAEGKVFVHVKGSCTSYALWGPNRSVQRRRCLRWQT